MIQQLLWAKKKEIHLVFVMEDANQLSVIS
jgi:hypothetical protein